AFSAASALGVPTGLFLADKMSWHAPFLFLGITGLIILFFIRMYLPRIDSHLKDSVRRNLFTTFRHIGSDKNQLRALALGLVIVLGHFIIIPFITPYMIRNVGFSQSNITLIYLFGGMLTMFTSPFIGRLTDKYGAIRVFTTAMIISFI